jgi:hypothetical protein
MSLKSIAPYLRKTKKIAMTTNEDDLILGPGEVNYLQDVFGERAIIWPNGDQHALSHESKESWPRGPGFWLAVPQRGTNRKLMNSILFLWQSLWL